MLRTGGASAATQAAGIASTVCSKCGGRMKVLEIVTDPNAIARLLHGARAPPRPYPPGQLGLFVFARA